MCSGLTLLENMLTKNVGPLEAQMFYKGPVMIDDHNRSYQPEMVI